MNAPKLKNALLCRILVYVVVIGIPILAITLAVSIPVIPLPVRVLVCIGSAVGLLIYVVRNFAVLMAMDMALAVQHCRNTARRRFHLPRGFCEGRVERRLRRIGRAYEPTSIEPRPELLRYRSRAPITGYASGTETVVALYRTRLLTKEGYHATVRSATANSEHLKGRRRHLLLDREQKKAPLCRVTVALILADRLESGLIEKMDTAVCKNGGDGFDTAVLPCVVDLLEGVCVFDSERIPYTGFQYPVKNRGIAIIRKCVFGGRLPLGEEHRLEPIRDLDPEQSLWAFWRWMQRELVEQDREQKRRFERMAHGEIVLDDGFLYLKWQDRGVCLAVELDEASRRAEVDAIDAWDYPKPNAIAHRTADEMRETIRAYFASRGYTVTETED